MYTTLQIDGKLLYLIRSFRIRQTRSAAVYHHYRAVKDYPKVNIILYYNINTAKGSRPKNNSHS